MENDCTKTNNEANDKELIPRCKKETENEK